MTTTKINLHMICSTGGCENHVHAGGVCSIHYMQNRRAELATTEQRVCSVKGCTDHVEAKSMCNKHYMADYRARKRQARAEALRAA